MNEAIRASLTQVFTDHTSRMAAAAHRRASRGQEERRLEEAFRIQFEAHVGTVILPLFEQVSNTVRENGHACTITCATHETFFSGSDESPGVIFMFYPDSVPEEDYLLQPRSSYVAVFADLSLRHVRLYAKSVRPGGFAPGQLPDLLSLSELTTERLTAACIDVIKETMHRMEAQAL